MSPAIIDFHNEVASDERWISSVLRAGRLRYCDLTIDILRLGLFAGGYVGLHSSVGRFLYGRSQHSRLLRYFQVLFGVHKERAL